MATMKNLLTMEKAKKIIGLKFEKNYNRVFYALEKEFPSWASFDTLNAKYKFHFLSEDDLIKLKDDRFLESKEDYKITQTGPQEWTVKVGIDGKHLKIKYFRLLNRGFEFIDNLRAKKTNKFLFVLTLILSFIGLIQISLMIWQIVLQYRVLG
mgnify:CR=1 FL=1